MATGQMTVLIQNLRKVALRHHTESLTDAALLEVFLAERDEAAFEALVRRHGPMVLGVCRRVLWDAHDVEDAFQATFLVLVRKASSIRQRETVGNWLYGVAYRIALAARRANVRRSTKEKQVTNMPETQTTPEEMWQELQPLLDQELNSLPDKYRLPVVLCDLEGRTRKEVARQLQIPEGTLSNRLSTARRMLAKRLARHGIALSGGAVATIVSQNAASACVPTSLVVSAVKAAASIAAGKAVATAIVSAKVAALTEGMVKAMLMTKLKSGSMLLLVACCLAAALGALASRAIQAGPLGAAHQGQRQLANADAQPGKRKPAKLLKVEQMVDSLSFSPDGKLLAGASHEGDVNGKSTLRLWDPDTGDIKDSFGEFPAGEFWKFHVVCFSPDGKTLAASAGGLRVNSIVGEVRLFDVKTGVIKHTLEHNIGHAWALAFSRDGKTLATSSLSKAVKLWDVESGKLRTTIEVADTQVFAVALSPDGKTVASGGSTYKDGEMAEIKLWDVEMGKFKQSLAQPEHTRSLAFSPDGKVLVSGSGDVKLWDAQTCKLEHKLGSGYFAVFSPDGKTVAAGTEGGGVTLWDVASGELKEELEGHVGHVHALAFSRDGRMLATGGKDKTIRLWRIKK